MPLEGLNGGYASAAQVEAAAARFLGNNVSAYSSTKYEVSAHKRPVAVTMPGEGNIGKHPTTYVYRTNDSVGEYACPLLKVNHESGALSVEGVYRPASLDVKVTADGDAHSVIEFCDDAGRLVLKRRLTGEVGRTYADSLNVWYVRDWKGSVRYTVHTNPATGTTVAAGHTFTYPSGLPVHMMGATTTDRLHQDKPWIEAEGIGWYDNAARIYDPITMRFLTPDPLAHTYTDFSPYTYCLGNPLSYIDNNGKQPIGNRFGFYDRFGNSPINMVVQSQSCYVNDSNLHENNNFGESRDLTGLPYESATSPNEIKQEGGVATNIGIASSAFGNKIVYNLN